MTGVKRGRTRSSDDAEDNNISLSRIDSFRGHIFSRLDSSRPVQSEESELPSSSKTLAGEKADDNYGAQNSGKDVEVSGNTLGIGDTILAGIY